MAEVKAGGVSYHYSLTEFSWRVYGSPGRIAFMEQSRCSMICEVPFDVLRKENVLHLRIR